MRKLSLNLKMALIAFTLLTSNAIFAQVETESTKMEKKGRMADRERPSSDEMVAKLTEKMKKDLTLSDEQTAKVLEINKTFAAARQTSKGNKEAFKEANSSRMESLKTVLNDDQMKKFKEDQAKAMDKMRERRGNGEKPNRRGNK